VLMQGWEGAERSSSGRGVVAIGQLLIGEERKGEGGLTTMRHVEEEEGAWRHARSSEGADGWQRCITGGGGWWSTEAGDHARWGFSTGWVSWSGPMKRKIGPTQRNDARFLFIKRIFN
jgi:hypothetical protein